MGCYSPITAFQGAPGTPISFRELPQTEKTLLLPCGQCVGCKLERSRQWAVRCLHEAKMNKVSVFATFTYGTGKMPPHGSLCYRDFQLFLKRLRKARKEPIRFVCCGEYGDVSGRPHYHAILFGVHFPDAVYWSGKRGRELYWSKELDELWTHGQVLVGSVTHKSAAYVARYVFKKVNGDRARNHYEILDPDTGELVQLEPEMFHMSLKPGIGFGFYEKYRDEMYPKSEVITEGRPARAPKYYDLKERERDPDRFEIGRNARELAALDRLSDNSPERLKVKAEVASARLKFKQRSL